MSLSSALSISASAAAPRIAFLDYPLGRTAGPPFDPTKQRDVTLRALKHIRDAKSPGEVLVLPHRWAANDDWKDGVMQKDSRLPRHDEPQYQTPADADAADPTCPTCVFLTA
ncbi:MAG: hypothetical protein OXI55_02370 [Gammaproteobacteria bacterium]|nr:hypothetical protein [Gammaproteobacteria bacterium]